MADALMDRIKAHRGAPDVYDPPTFDQMADRILELEAENKKLNEQMDAIEEMGTESLNALPDCLMRLAPALVENGELKAKLAVAGKALNRLLRPPNGHPHIEAATKEEWAVRAMNAEDKLAKVIEDLEQKLCDYCDEADPMRQAMCLAKECGVAVTEMTPKLSK